MVGVVGIAELFAAARDEPRKAFAIVTYRKALAAWEASGRDVSTFRIVDLIAQVYRGLAYELEGIERERSWLNAMAVLRTYTDLNDSHEAIVAFGMTAIDFFQDRLTPSTRAEKQSRLIEATNFIDRKLSTSIDKESRHELLAAKSAILRQRAAIEVSETRRAQRLSESQRCIRLAAIEDGPPWIALEAQLINLDISREAKSDLDFANQIRAITAGLSTPALQNLEAAQFALAALYRFTNQPLECCELWATILSSTRHSRPLYRSAHIYAEAATQLACKDIPKELVVPHLQAALRLSEEALAAGYGTARLIIATAFLTAEISGTVQGASVLRDLYNGADGINWDEALRLVASEDASDATIKGLASGIDQSGVWCRLGTFASRYLQDFKLAEVLFRSAIRLNQRNAVALTNLARLLIRKGSNNDLSEAARLLSRAQNFASRRFLWWREVQKELDSIRVLKSSAGTPKPVERRAHNVADLRRRFRAVASLDSAQARGYELEDLVFLLAGMTVAVAAPGYHADRVDGEIRQIDGYLEHGPNAYRVECKWESSPIGQNEVVLFKNKLDVTGVGGLIFSMGGFRDTAIAAAINARTERAILLIDGEEILALFEGRVSLDEMLGTKRSQLNQCSNPYFRVTSGGQIVDSS